MQDSSLATRNLANIVYRLGGGKNDFDSIWPLDGREKETIAAPTRELLDRMKAKQKAVDADIAKLKSNKKK